MGRKITPVAERKVPVITLLPCPVREKVERIAASEGVSLSEITRRAVMQFVEELTS